VKGVTHGFYKISGKRGKDVRNTLGIVERETAEKDGARDPGEVDLKMDPG